jgi:acyl transferase domain-containing protein
MKMERFPNEQPGSFPVAVVGLHGRFPGAVDVRSFWDNLRQRRDPITKIPPDRWDWEELYGEPVDGAACTYANTGAFAPFVDRFDARFFDIMPREAESMDPQQRLFLQTSFAALEDAGFAPKELAGGRVGVFVGVGYPDYPLLMREDGAPFDAYRGTGIAPTAIANRVSFALNLRGPSETIDTACSGSLVAIHRAIQSLQLGESEIAIAGGVNLLLGPDLFIAFAQAGMLSRTGRCRTFDAAADGYVRGEGVAALLLRPLKAAEADGDFIYGVIRGSAENHGGKTNSFTAPSVSAQADLVASAWRKSGLSITDAVLIETHGTGTPLGDPIEVQGLKRALEGADTAAGGGRRQTALCALKTQIGHLEGAAGVAGVIKALLALHHRLIPANLHYEAINPKIDLHDTPFYIPSEPIELDTTPEARLFAGVSGFGFGGTNAHVVVESYSRHGPAHSATEEECPYLFPISARTKEALIGRIRQLIAYLAVGEDAPSPVSLGEVSAALGLGSFPEGAGDIRLTSLCIGIERLTLALERLGKSRDCLIHPKDIRDCVTLGELAERIGEIGRATKSLSAAEDGLLLPQVAISDDLVRKANLDEISFALTHGRDAMAERLAIIAASKPSLRAQLERFSAAPDQQSETFFSGSVRRPLVSPVEAPEADQSQSTNEDYLRQWALHWVTTRTACLDWLALHGRPAPKKIPLPAYPFALTRHWYSKGDSVQLVRKAATETHQPAQPLLGIAPDVASPVEASAANLKGHRSGPRLAELFPSSAAALACLLEQRASQSTGQAIHLEGLEFGRPIVIQENGLQCESASGRGGTIVQCLHGAAGNRKVLLQARLGKGAFTPPPPEREHLRPVDCNAIYETLGRIGLPRDTGQLEIDAAAIGDGIIRLKTKLVRNSEETAFWAPFFAALFAGEAMLREASRREEPPAFYRAAMAVFAIQRAQLVTEISVRRHAGRMIDVTATGASGAPVLWLSGLELRPAIRVAAARAETDAHAEAVAS